MRFELAIFTAVDCLVTRSSCIWRVTLINSTTAKALGYQRIPILPDISSLTSEFVWLERHAFVDLI